MAGNVREFARVCGAAARALLPDGAKFAARARPHGCGPTFLTAQPAHNRICGDVERFTEGRDYDITVQADSSSEARQTVIDMFPGALVTGVRRVKLREALPKL